MIVKRGKNWLVKSESGKTIGTHASEGDAKAQLAAIEMARARRKEDEGKPRKGYFVAKP